MKMGNLIKVVWLVMVVAMVVKMEAIDLCNMSEDGLMACKPAVTAPEPADPTAECCQALSGADLSCLCSYRNSFVLPSLGIDPDLALALPSKCNLTPPANC
ncbi:hypothetical protein DCAR_0521316 [Daucus carota subsp. sativus]|uniref:Bifunctional inhibitor/plant lipid transfer protein/seed storage helical domain-containing protein n=1 Tax=Daucus carota subsp. sativus TaxID=79200 RepID=A0AAF0X666_DAUCS|nr:PREDICTED: putative lipid-transfer protein DIR1 [Daucus carota subsp. sativus]WOH01930.1 hypothetical protein DCAR_0521316 [Daucus carota subsp. sativus]